MRTQTLGTRFSLVRPLLPNIVPPYDPDVLEVTIEGEATSCWRRRRLSEVTCPSEGEGSKDIDQHI